MFKTTASIVILATLTMIAPVRTTAQDSPDISGTWSLEYDGSRGPVNWTLHFQKTEDDWGGTADTSMGEMELSEITVSATDISFVIEFSYTEGSYALLFSGEITSETSMAGWYDSPVSGRVRWTAELEEG